MMHNCNAIADKVIEEPTRGECGRILISTRGILEWAFGVECASIDHNEVGRIGPVGHSAISATARVGEIGDLGVRVDTFGGKSYPHDDAELVATTVRNAVESWDMAVRVAELARAGRTPDWDLGPSRVVPQHQSRGRFAGQKARSEVCGSVTYRSRRGWVTRKVLWCPVSIVPTGPQRGAARRAYLDWISALLMIRASLPTDQLSKFCVTKVMPPVTPWKKGVD